MSGFAALVLLPGAAADSILLELPREAPETIEGVQLCIYYSPNPDVGADVVGGPMVWFYFVGSEPDDVANTGFGVGSEHAGAAHECPASAPSDEYRLADSLPDAGIPDLHARLPGIELP